MGILQRLQCQSRGEALETAQMATMTTVKLRAAMLTGHIRAFHWEMLKERTYLRDAKDQQLSA
jgi:hypothetical protein